MTINVWQADSGRSPVMNFINSQDVKAGQRIMKDIDHLEEQGVALQHTKKLKKLQGYTSLYELITNFRGMGYRIIFTIIKGDAWLLEAFKKKSSDTPRQYIDTAIGRRNLLLNNVS